MAQALILLKTTYFHQDNIKLALMEARYRGKDWLNLAKNMIHWQSFCKTCYGLSRSIKAGKFLEKLYEFSPFQTSPIQK
jgi:hypothetical protein